MQFHGKISVYRYEKNDWEPEVTDIFNEKFKAAEHPVRQSKTHKNRKRNRTVFVDSVLGQRNTGIHRQGSTLEALEQSARYL